jgi:hypothetical protein
MLHALLIAFVGFLLFPGEKGPFSAHMVVFSVAALSWRLIAGDSTLRIQIGAPVVVTSSALPFSCHQPCYPPAPTAHSQM